MAVLTPQPKMQFTTAAGVPLSGGKVYTYIAGTTTPQATFTDYTGATPNPNPVILDSRGEANIWLGGALYKFKLTDANDVEIWTVDYISAPTSSVSAVLSGNVSIDSDTPGPALKITQTGTGPVLRVQDSADPDTTPFIIDNAGNVGIGTPTPTVQLEATGAARFGSLTLTGSPLPVASGGTGLATLTANNVLIGAGTGNVTFVAPGASGNVLTSDGTLWQSQTLPADQARREVFNSSGTWTKPSGISSSSPVYIQVWAAGGSGARHTNGVNGGGGGGGYLELWTVLSALGATETVTVGAGGAARTGSNQAGAAGGNSSVGAILIAYGGGGAPSPGSGVGGFGGGALANLAAAGALRTGGNGGETDSGNPSVCNALYGGAGGAGQGSGGVLTFPGNLSPVYGGNGGASASGTAASGSAPGGGGGGATGTSGAGAAGRVIITVFPGV
jgi:hypothetical protein